jgi:S-DNA-T family DNA segregation ATPase FtsK/SpoIIIE
MESTLSLLVHVQVRLADLPGRAGESLGLDLELSISAGARVADLLTEVLRETKLHIHDHVDVEESFREDAVGLTITLRHASQTSRAIEVLLPDGALLSDLMRCGLWNGVELSLRERSNIPIWRFPVPPEPASSDTPPSTGVDEVPNAGDTEPLFLVDEMGTFKARETYLPEGAEIIITTTPAAAADQIAVVVDDASLPSPICTLVRTGGSAQVTALAAGSELLVNGTPVAGQPAALRPGSLIAVRDRLAFSITTREGLAERSPFGRVRFEPTARQRLPVYRRLRQTTVPEPPEPSTRTPFRPEAVLVSPAIGVVMYLVSHSLPFLFISMAQPIVYGIGYFRQLLEGRAGQAAKIADWNDAIADFSADFSARIAEERTGRLTEAPPIGTWLRRAFLRLPGLWERRVTDRDFLLLRMGYGDLTSGLLNEIVFPDGAINKTNRRRRFLQSVLASRFLSVRGSEAEDLYLRVASLKPDLSRNAKMADVPATADLNVHNIALIGDLRAVAESVNNLLLQISGAHSPSQVAIGALLPKDPILHRDLEWLKWLPHFQAASEMLPPEPWALGRLGANQLLESVLDTVKERLRYRNDLPLQHAVVIVHESAEVDLSLLVELGELAAGLVHVIWIGSGRGRVPQLCDLIIQVDADGAGAHPELRSGYYEWHPKGFRLERVATGVATRAARALAPLFDPRASGASAGIPSMCSLSTIVDLLADVGATPDPATSLPIPIGVVETGTFALDLVNDGPHVLIGGTTGSGKSELLQTLVASTISLYSATQVNLFLIDFKGGSTFALFRDIPHTVGFVSDLTPSEVSRAIAFIGSELRRRLLLFAQTMNRDGSPCRDYVEYHAANSEPLPRLVIIFDEFATLVEEHSEALKSVLDIAQRGRSLGVHLILATQQPSGDVVSSRVRANVSARIALRTLDTSNSETIIGSPEAARIPRTIPGRGYARLEGDRLVQFQTAYALSEQLRERLVAGQSLVSSRLFSMDRTA